MKIKIINYVIYRNQVSKIGLVKIGRKIRFLESLKSYRQKILTSMIGKEYRMKKQFRLISIACRIPSYGDLLFCLDEIINNKSLKDEKDINNLKDIIDRAKIVCIDYNRLGS